MPVIKGSPKKLINYKIPHDLEKKVDNAIDRGDFSSQADLLTAALHYYFNNTEIEERIRAFLQSEEGKELIRRAMNPAPPAPE